MLGNVRTIPQSGMTIFELMWFVLIVAGAVCGGRCGYAHFGTWGAVLGVPLGGGIGFLAAATAAFLLAVVFKTLLGGTIFPPRAPKSDASNKKS